MVGSLKKRGHDSILTFYLMYKQLGLKHLDLSLNNQAIKYLLKAQCMLFHMITILPDQFNLQALVKNTFRSTLYIIVLVQQFNQVFKIINGKLTKKGMVVRVPALEAQMAHLELDLLAELTGI